MGWAFLDGDSYTLRIPTMAPSVFIHTLLHVAFILVAHGVNGKASVGMFPSSRLLSVLQFSDINP